MESDNVLSLPMVVLECACTYVFPRWHNVPGLGLAYAVTVLSEAVHKMGMCLSACALRYTSIQVSRELRERP